MLIKSDYWFKGVFSEPIVSQNRKAIAIIRHPNKKLVWLQGNGLAHLSEHRNKCFVMC